jgi:hypothetical protein
VLVEEDNTDTDIATTGMTTKRPNSERALQDDGGRQQENQDVEDNKKLGPQRRNNTKAATGTDKDNDDGPENETTGHDEKDGWPFPPQRVLPISARLLE